MGRVASLPGSQMPFPQPCSSRVTHCLPASESPGAVFGDSLCPQITLQNG